MGEIVEVFEWLIVVYFDDMFNCLFVDIFNGVYGVKDFVVCDVKIDLFVVD